MTGNRNNDDLNWMRRLAKQRAPETDARKEHAHRRHSNMKPDETLAEARRRWRAEGRCRDCGQPLIKDGRQGGARCGSYRAGAGRRRGRRRAEQTP